MKTLEEVAEEVRTYMEQNKMAAGSVHARSMLLTLYKIGYFVVPMDSTNSDSES